MSVFPQAKPYLNRSAYSDWIESSVPVDKDYWFLTLTMKQGIQRNDGMSWEPLTREAADQNVSWFLKELNREVFGHAYKKYGKRLIVIDAAEGGDGSIQRRHRHMLIEKPSRYTDEDWKMLIQTSWSRSRWGYRQVELVRANSRTAVVKYMTKNGGDALCLCNTTL
jgi:hypothetical protein